jgi:PAS domain S-box-containing protein
MNLTDPSNKEISHSLLRKIVSQTSDLIVTTDPHRKITYVNQIVCEKTGYTRDELIGANVWVLYPKTYRAKYTSIILQKIQKKEYRIGEVQLSTKDGLAFWVDLALHPWYDADNIYSGIIYTGRDVSERHLLEQYRMASENHLQKVIESMDDAIAVCDPDGTILACNQAHCRMLGYEREEIVGRKQPYPWIDLLDRKKFRFGVRVLFKRGYLKNYTLAWHRCDNTSIVVSAAFSLLRDSSGDISGYVVTSRDITDVHYVEELRRTNDRMQRLVIDVQRKAERLQTLEEVNSLVLNGADVIRIFKSVVRGIKKLVAHDLAGIYVYNSEHDCLYAHTMSKLTPFSRRLSKFPLRLGEGIIGAAAVTGRLVIVNNAQRDPRSRYPECMKPDLEHFIAVPLSGRNSIFGVLVVARNSDPEFLEEEAMIVKAFADATTVALEHARMSLELNKIQPSFPTILGEMDGRLQKGSLKNVENTVGTKLKSERTKKESGGKIPDRGTGHVDVLRG